jgi:hypothetical protein
MVKTKTGLDNKTTLSYQLIRNITSPDEKAIDVQSFVCNLQASEILKLGTTGNLRHYIAEYNARKRNRVHEAIRSTIDTAPQRFIVRNGGFLIVGSDITIDDDKKLATLTDANVLGGAQTQGEIQRYIAEFEGSGESPGEFFVRGMIIIDNDPNEIMETAIARNIVTPVKSLSIAGARSQLNELQKSVQKTYPNLKIRMTESDAGPEYLDTRFLLQLARLLMPTEVSGNPSAAEKLRAYKNPEQCLTDFTTWYESRSSNGAAAAKYKFVIDIAPQAWALYKKWEAHDGWNGLRIFEETKKGGRAIRRDRKTGRITWVSPGLLFPLMGALSEFATVDDHGRWVIKQPRRFREDELITRTVNQFRAHNSDPMLMGRSEGAYDAARIYPQTLVEVLREVGQGNGETG